LNELPNGWHWTITDQLFWFVTSGSRGWAKYYSDSGAVFFRIGNLDHNSVSLDLNKIQCVKPPKGAEGTRTKVEENDILISITADVGMIGVVPRSFEEAYINQHISLARPVSSVNSLYIAWYLTSRLGQNQFVALQRGATKAGLGLDDIRSVNIPIPPFEEQAEVISQIEKRLSVVHEIEIEVDKNLKRTVRLRQSILKKAFSGKLVS
jgi:type I restriction enzyme S subunit